MIFTQTPLESAFVVDPEPVGDDRGFFTRAFCANEFEAHGLKPAVVQTNMSYNHRKGTIRGLHYQRAPAAETKFMRCISGAIWDVIVDLRPGSPTHMQHFGVELSAENRRALYVPERFAHGYLSLSDGAEVLYTVSEFYTPGVEGGYRFDDPALGIEWPIPVDVISEKDASWPLIGS